MQSDAASAHVLGRFFDGFTHGPGFVSCGVFASDGVAEDVRDFDVFEGDPAKGFVAWGFSESDELGAGGDLVGSEDDLVENVRGLRCEMCDDAGGAVDGVLEGVHGAGYWAW